VIRVDHQICLDFCCQILVVVDSLHVIVRLVWKSELLIHQYECCVLFFWLLFIRPIFLEISPG